MRRIDTEQTKLAIVNEAPIARAGFSPDEPAVCETLAARTMTMVELRHAFPMITPVRLDRLIYLLLLTRSAERAAVVAETGPRIRRSGSMDADTLAPAVGPAQLGAAAIAMRAQTIEDEDPFQILYFQLVKQWHPDRVPAALATATSAGESTRELRIDDMRMKK